MNHSSTENTEFPIYPNYGVGDLRFGMGQSDVQALLLDEGFGLDEQETDEDGLRIDVYGSGALAVQFDEEGAAILFALSEGDSGMLFSYNGVDVFDGDNRQEVFTQMNDCETELAEITDEPVHFQDQHMMLHPDEEDAEGAGWVSLVLYQ